MNTKDGRHLSSLLDDAARQRPQHCAVEDEYGRTLRYSELAFQADRIAARLSRWGVGRGDRIGIWLPKSLESVVAIHGILRAGAAYVPVDATGPALRGASIFATSGVKVVIAGGAGGLGSEMAEKARAKVKHGARRREIDVAGT